MEGLSYQVTSAYYLNKSTRIPFSIEHIFKGREKTEYSLGLERRWGNQITTQSRIIKGVKWGLQHQTWYHWTNSMAFSIGWSRYSGENLFGARHIPSIADPSLIYDEFFMSMQYQF